MPVITIDPSLLAHLATIKEPTDIVDPSGNLLGTFTPAPEQESVAHLFDPAELKRRKEAAKGKPGKPLSEILKKLAAQENPT